MRYVRSRHTTVQLRCTTANFRGCMNSITTVFGEIKRSYSTRKVHRKKWSLVPQVLKIVTHRCMVRSVHQEKHSIYF